MFLPFLCHPFNFNIGCTLSLCLSRSFLLSSTKYILCQAVVDELVLGAKPHFCIIYVFSYINKSLFYTLVVFFVVLWLFFFSFFFITHIQDMWPCKKKSQIGSLVDQNQYITTAPSVLPNHNIV